MPANEIEQESLSDMLEIVGQSSRARMLACSLWNFFKEKLECRRPGIDVDRPNSFHIEIEQFLISRNLGDLRPEIVVRRNGRQEAGLVHELLHLNLIPLGFPCFRIWADDDEDWDLAGGIINNAEHVPMLHTFLSLGYSEADFLGPFMRPYSAREQRVFDDLEKLEALLLTPREYGSAVGSYLTNRSIKHEIVWIADLAVV